ncbi:MAG: beta-propeller fold lactonase family protein, partial [Mucilaginibacter sp.]
MKRLLFIVNILPVLFMLCSTARAQNQTVTNGDVVTPASFPGAGCTYNWVNSNPGIGLPASGTGDISSFKAVNTGSSPVVAHITVTPVSVSYAYITELNNNAVAVINTLTNKIATTIPVGIGPQGVAVSPDGSRIYISNSNSGPGTTNGTISVINGADNTALPAIPGSADPYGIVVSPDNKWVYVVNSSSSSVSFVNVSTNDVTIIPTIYQPNGIMVSPDGKYLYVTTPFIGGGYLLVINTATHTILPSIPVEKNPIGVAVSADGSRIYVANAGSDDVEVFDAATYALMAKINIPTGSFPSAIVISPDGTRVYVTNNESSDISVIDATTNKLITTIPDGGKNPQGASTSPDGKYLYVANSTSNDVSVIDTKTYAITNLIKIGDNSTPISFGNFISPSSLCSGAPISFTITVNSQPPTIIHSTATGTIISCVGSVSASPNIQQFTVSSSNLTGNITATAPQDFEVSLSPGSGYGKSVAIPQKGSAAINVTVYVRSAASAPVGNISGSVSLTFAGAAPQNVTVVGTVDALPAVDPVAGLLVYSNG